MGVQFFFADKNITLTDRTALKLFIKKIFKKEKRSFESLSYVFCSDEYLLAINQQYLQHDYYTDIITFDLSEPSLPLQGDIYISVDRVRDNAFTHGTSIKEELHRVIFHGALHLCGFKDKKPADIKKMREAEDKYLNLYFK